MKKEKWIIRLLVHNMFAIALSLVPLTVLSPYISGFSAMFLGLSISALVGVLLGRIGRLEDSIKELRNELQEKDYISKEDEAL